MGIKKYQKHSTKTKIVYINIIYVHYFKEKVKEYIINDVYQKCNKTATWRKDNIYFLENKYNLLLFI